MSKQTNKLLDLTALGMRFKIRGGYKQLVLDRGDAIRFLKSLDETLWVTLSCPVKGLEFDTRTLELIDCDSDGRIRCPEVIAAADWLDLVLTDLSYLEEEVSELPLTSIRGDTVEGKAIQIAANRVLVNLNKADSNRISLSDALSRNRIIATTLSNGDGVISSADVEEEALKFAIDAILQITGGVCDLTGQHGISQDSVKLFYDALDGYRKWLTQGEALSAEEHEKVFPFSDQTAEAWNAFKDLEDHVDQFFHDCEIAAYDSRAIDVLNPGLNVLGEGSLEKERFPIARINAEGILPLRSGVHPVYKKQMSALCDDILSLIFSKPHDTLNMDQWQMVKDIFCNYRSRIEAKPPYPYEELSDEQLLVVDQSGIRAKIESLIQLDLEVGKEIEAITELERLLRYTKDFLRFCNNFVSMPDFYSLDKHAIFQTGEMLIDGRRMTLCVEVKDYNEHIAIAARSGIYMIYCDVSRGDGAGKKIIAAAVTAGTSGRLDVGKNGIFYDRSGVDWEARVVRVITHPISLSEAVIAPFKRLGSLISSQIEKLAESREKEMQQSISSGVSDFDKSISKPVQVAQSSTNSTDQQRSGGMGGILAGGGFAIAAVGSSFAIIAEKLKAVGTSGIIYTVIVILLFLLVPSLIVAFFRLRNRDLGGVLEAGGWAINGQMRLNFELSRCLTRRASLLLGAKDHSVWARWPFILLFVLAVFEALYILI